VPLAEGTTVDHLDLQIVNDGRHSVPTILSVSGDGQPPTRIDLPVLPEQATPISVPISFPPVSRNSLTVTIGSVEPRYTTDRRYGDRVMLPVAIAELGIPGYTAPPVPTTFDTGCYDGVTVDGTAVQVRVQGDTAAALAGAPLAIEPCSGVDLSAGEHVVASIRSSIAIDQLVLSSPMTAPPTRPDPTVRVVTNDSTHRVVDVGALTPFWLTLGEGYNDGWHANIGGRDLGAPRMVDGGANGWLVSPPAGGGAVEVSLTWQPQRVVNAGLLLSAFGIVACLVLLVFGRRWERPLLERPPPPALDNPLVGGGASLGVPGARVTALVVALGVALLLDPVWAVPIGLATFASARWPRWRPLLSLGAVSGAVLVGVLYVARQVISDPLPGFGWVTRFEFADHIAFAALLLLVIDAVVERRRPSGAPAYHDSALRGSKDHDQH
jgi:arabinofuranan 3-O-arabinosyltransferase